MNELTKYGIIFLIIGLILLPFTLNSEKKANKQYNNYCIKNGYDSYISFNEQNIIQCSDNGEIKLLEYTEKRFLTPVLEFHFVIFSILAIIFIVCGDLRDMGD